MERRRFLLASLLAGVFGRSEGGALMQAIMDHGTSGRLPRRTYKDGVELSVIGCGGIVVMGMTQKEADRAVADAVARGVNYFDVAPSYGDGEAEEKMGRALAPWRKDAFLACKTMHRDAPGAQRELDRSLNRLKTDHVDLYQFHAVTTTDDVEQIFERGGAMETYVKARDAGTVRHIGFSAHSETAALMMMDRFPFDSVLFPVNLVCYARGNFGPAVMAKAKEKGVARLALKMLTRGPWPEGAERSYSKAWYQPIDDPAAARDAVRFTLSEDVTSAIPPGDIRLFNLAVDLAVAFEPLSVEERTEILAGTQGMEPLFRS